MLELEVFRGCAQCFGNLNDTGPIAARVCFDVGDCCLTQPDSFCQVFLRQSTGFTQSFKPLASCFLHVFE